MDPVVKTVLPLVTWTLRRAFGPVFEPSLWRAVALSLMPPPDNVVNVLERESSGLDTRRLLAASERRRIRKNYKKYVGDQLRDNRMCLAAREHFLQWRRRLEAEGYTSDPTQIRKLRDIQIEVNDYYSRLAETQELRQDFPWLRTDSEQDAVSLLWEFAVYGEGGIKPRITHNSGVWRALGLDPVQLETMAPEDAFMTFFARFEALLGLNDGRPEEANLKRLLRWILKTHLPPEQEPETTPHAISMATDTGLIYKGVEVRDRETGEIKKMDVEDPESSDFVRQIEERDELERIISRVKLSPGEKVVLKGLRAGLQGDGLADWVEGQGARLSRKSVPVLASRVMSKLRETAKN